MTTIDIVLSDGSIEPIELVCESCGEELDVADPHTELLDRLLCSECARTARVEGLELAA